MGKDWPRILLLAGAAGWVAGLVLAPLGRAGDWALASGVYQAFQTICHQIPERSFHLAGHPLPVCHRCMGIYAGFAAGVLLLPYLHGLRKFLLAHPRWMLAGFALVALDVFLIPNTWWTRFATGWLAAFPVAAFVQVAFRDLLAPRRAHSGATTGPHNRTPCDFGRNT